MKIRGVSERFYLAVGLAILLVLGIPTAWALRKNVSDQRECNVMYTISTGQPKTTGTVEVLYTHNNSTAETSAGNSTLIGSEWCINLSNTQTNSDSVTLRWHSTDSLDLELSRTYYTTEPQTGDAYAYLGSHLSGSINGTLAAGTHQPQSGDAHADGTAIIAELALLPHSNGSATFNATATTAIAVAVRDVDNTTPAADSLGEAINNAGGASLTSGDAAQIRYKLQIDGTQTAPSVEGNNYRVASETTANDISGTLANISSAYNDDDLDGTYVLTLGGSTSDWTGLRYRLSLDGTKTAPTEFSAEVNAQTWATLFNGENSPDEISYSLIDAVRFAFIYTATLMDGALMPLYLTAEGLDPATFAPTFSGTIPPGETITFKSKQVYNRYANDSLSILGVIDSDGVWTPDIGFTEGVGGDHLIQLDITLGVGPGTITFENGDGKDRHCDYSPLDRRPGTTNKPGFVSTKTGKFVSVFNGGQQVQPGAPTAAQNAAAVRDVAQLATPVAGSAGEDWADAAAGGGTGLSAQETRDAMKLAPTSGAPAAGSVDAHLDATALESTVLGQFGVTWGTTYPIVNRDGIISVPRGDVYTISTTLGAAFPLAGRTAYFIAQKTKSANNTTAIVNRAMTITDVSARTCTITLTAAELAITGRYLYEIELRDTTTGANPSTAEAGTLNIIEDLRK